MHTGAIGKAISVEARGKFGYSGAFGRIAFGYNRFGFYSWWCGIYQKKYIWGKPYFSKMKFYRPTNPQTLTQQAWRENIKTGVLAWRDLPSLDKIDFNNRAVPLKMSGYNLFLREWLYSHKD